MTGMRRASSGGIGASVEIHTTHTAQTHNTQHPTQQSRYPIERYAPVFELCRGLGLPLVALGSRTQDMLAVESKGLGGLDAAAWARLSLPEGPEALVPYADSEA